MARVALQDGVYRDMSAMDSEEVDEVVEVGPKITKSGKPMTRVVAKRSAPQPEEEETETGYVEDEVLEQFYESTVSIPQNFAGLESVMVPTRLRNQLFDIIDVKEEDGYVEVTAIHMFYRQRQNYTLFDPDLTTKYTGAAACRNVMTNAMFTQEFKVASDSTEQIMGNQLDFARKNIVEAFLDPESGICARYGLSLIRDNDLFYCLKNVGYDRGFIVQSGKNMLGVERTESIENLVTRVAPVGRDEDGELVWMNHNGLKYIDSSHINDYVSPMMEIYQTDIRIGEDGTTASNIQDKLLAAAQKRFSEDHVDIPEVTMTVQFISLGDTEEYQQYRDLDKVYLYDIIHIKDTKRGYNYAAQVIGVQHDILTGRLESVTIGTPQKWDGIRKIGSWQVPDFNGGKIRPGSIRAKSFEDGAVQADDIASSSIDARHFSTGSASTSGQSAIKGWADDMINYELTSEDGSIHTRFTVTDGLIQTEVERATSAEGGLSSRISQEADRISLVVEGTGANAHIKPASIIAAINEQTGQSTAIISADFVDLDGYVTMTAFESLEGDIRNLTTGTTKATKLFASQMEVEDDLIIDSRGDFHFLGHLMGLVTVGGQTVLGAIT